MNRKKDGGYYWVRATIVPFLNETGKPYQYVAIRTDITERVKAEEELEHSKAKAEQAQVQAETANRTKSDLMANISHELRTPLNAIIGFSGSMKEEIFGPLGNDKYREYLDDIHNSGRHLLELINDVLDISAIEAGAMELREDNIDINSLVDAAIRIVTPRAEEGRVTVASNVDEEIPHIFVDERRVTQIVLNLLTNAIKFTPENGDVTVSARINDDGSLDIIIQDTGIGMDDGEIAEAMSKFGQVDSALDRKHEGTGLGLPLTLGLTELHGGTILISSEKGVGTSVTICFPHDRVVKDT